MADEQTIYISQEDDLTTVRERLERIPTRRVTLVIPTQTQLRSHVAWKLLYARARELGKEVLIVSSDPQVRSVAHAVKFKVAHSLESSPAGRSRPASRPARSSVGVRSRPPTTPTSRSSSARGAAESRGSTSGSTRSRPLRQQPEQWYDDAPESPPTQPEPESVHPQSRPDEIVTGGLSKQIFDLPSTFDASERMYTEPEDFLAPSVPPISPMPPIHPLTPQQVEEPDLLFEDYTQAQDIRQAASEKAATSEGAGTPPAKPGQAIRPDSEPGEAFASYRVLPLPNIADDPFASMEDIQPPPKLTEQRGAVSIEGFDALEEYNTGEHVIEDVGELPASIIEGEVEYQDDEGEFVPPPAPRGRDATTSRGHSARPFRRSGYLQPEPPDEFDEDGLPSLEELPTQVTPIPAEPPVVPPAREARGAASVSNRAQPATSRRAPAQPAQRPAQPARRTPWQAASRVPGSQVPARRKIPFVWLAVLIVILVIIGCVGYFVPSADVAITLYARDYTGPVSLVAHPYQQANTALAQKITKTFTASGTGKASGTTMVSSAIAKGSVTFTNTGSKAIDIPTGTTLATAGANSVQFVTTADAIIPVAKGQSNLAPPIPVQASKPGDSGNVAAGSITAIPDDSLSAIAQYPPNKVAVTDLKLTVTNPQATSGGGMRPAKTVTGNDLGAAKNALHQQLLQGDVNAWVKQLANTGVAGSPVVVDETLLNAPLADQVEDTGSFPSALKMDVAVLFLSNSALQNAAVVQLQNTLNHDKNYQNYAVVTDANPAVKLDQIKVTGGDANSLNVSFNAAAKVVPALVKSDIQKRIVGMPIKQAESTLEGIPNVQRVTITPHPSFIWFIPYMSEHVNVLIQAGSAQPAK